MLCSGRGVPATPRRDSAKQAGKAMLVNMVGGVLVTHVLAQDQVVQAACLVRRTCLTARVPTIVAIPSLVPCELILQYVLHCHLEAFFVLIFREL